MEVIITLLVSLLVLLVLFLIVIPLMIKSNSKEPGFERRWSDPSQHENFDPSQRK